MRVLVLLLAVALVSVLLALGVGSVHIGPGEIVDVLGGGGVEAHRTVVMDIRLPRVALAFVVGGALAVAGAVFQAMLRNPLADPYILGVSGGAALGAVSITVLATPAWLGGVTVGAALGALGAIALVLRVALWAGPGLDTRVLLLAGVIAGAFFNALILLTLTMADDQTFRSATHWMMGSLTHADLGDVQGLLLLLVPCLVAVLALARPLNLLAAGDDVATHLGVRVERVKVVGYLLASLVVAASVAVVGAVGFVGLIVPHAVRLLWGGSDHRLVLPASMLGGGAFLVLTDTAARSVAAPAELPTGVITSLIGVPLFAFLLVRQSR